MLTRDAMHHAPCSRERRDAARDAPRCAAELDDRAARMRRVRDAPRDEAPCAMTVQTARRGAQRAARCRRRPPLMSRYFSLPRLPTIFADLTPDCPRPLVTPPRPPVAVRRHAVRWRRRRACDAGGMRRTRQAGRGAARYGEERALMRESRYAANPKRYALMLLA